MTRFVTQIESDVVVSPASSARVTQAVLSAMVGPETVVRVTQVCVSVLVMPDTTNIRATQIVVSALRAAPERTPPAPTPVIAQEEKRYINYRPLSILLSVFSKTNQWLFNIDMADSFSYKILADGGYDSASLTIKSTQIDLNDWIINGIARRISAYFDGVQVWDGFVNRMSLKLGALTYTVGPLIDIGNRVWITYAPIDTTVSPAVVGDTTETTIAENEQSQDAFGVIEKVLDAGQVTDDDAERYRDTWLEAYAYPMASKDISLGEGEASITLELLGFGWWLDAYMYSNDSVAFTTATQKIKNVLTADPNSTFSTDYGMMEDNAYLVTDAALERNKTAKSVIDEIVPLGDINNNRWIFGVLENKKVYYKAIPTTAEYFQRLSDASQTIYDSSGNVVYPWMIKPGKWLYILDFLGSLSSFDDLSKDPRAIFIEEISYGTPWALSIRGGTVKNLSQLIAKQNMTG